MSKFLTKAKSAYLIRLDGPITLTWGGVGPLSIGRSDLPLNRPFIIREINVRHPSADGPLGMAQAGSKVERTNVQRRSVEEIFQHIRTQYPAFEWRAFATRDEAESFLRTGKTDLELFGLEEGYTSDQLKKSYRGLALTNHPDLTHGSGEAMQIITSAHKRLQESN